MDTAIVLWLNGLARSSSGFTGFVVGLAVVLPYVLVAVLGGALVLRWRVARSAVLNALMAGLVSRFVFVPVIRFLIPRGRPFMASIEIVKLFNREDAPSFPSGHAAFFFGVAFSLWFANRRWGWALLAGATLVGLGRIAAGVHYPSDVFVGALVGFASGWLIEKSWQWWQRRQQTPA
ncbi:phosphatase PAP2 family protein [Candidatus Parcubacteria bacterium]|nr:phosphatase PAP2 family protein [Candidatus Parcubacteria bacterium]